MSIWATFLEAGVDHDGQFDGTVRRYRENHSNHYPDDTDPAAYLLVCGVPGHCVPGHEDTEETDEFGPWLRLTVESGTVYMHRDAVTQLRATITEWLAIAVVQPDPLADPCEEWDR